ncbi:MAG: hypothetical protein ACREMY_24130 [bacterium]
MVNQIYTGTPTSRRFALCPTTLKAGDPVFLGGVPAIALDDYQSLTGGTTFLLGGTFALPVTGATALSPLTGHQINPGDKVYADGGSQFTPTNGPVVDYGFSLDANNGGVLFGNLDPSYVPVGSALTDAAAYVMLTGGL